jgi:F-type H+-transporting ATPase subunit b
MIMTVATAPHAPTTAHTEVAGGEEHGPTLLGLSAEGWVYTGVTIFFLIAIFVVKAHKIIAAGLDARIADTRKALDEAASLRKEADALLTDAKKKQSAAALDAKAMLAAAENEAGLLVAKAEADAKLLIERRQKMAEDNIASAERGAIAEVRAKAAAAAAAAAASLIGAQHNVKADAKLVDSAISQLN